jgi:hypothetical protein
MNQRPKSPQLPTVSVSTGAAQTLTARRLSRPKASAALGSDQTHAKAPSMPMPALKRAVRVAHFHL